MFEENVSAYLDTVSGFALDATYDPSGANTAVKVIFDNPYIEQAGIGTSNPTATGLASAFPASCIDKQIVISGTTYTIRGREPMDDGAFVILQLET